MRSPAIQHVRDFWNAHPVADAAIPFPRGTREYFEHFDRLRAEVEDWRFLERFHGFSAFAHRRVLDVGCGNGYVLSRYAAAGADVYGVDLTDTGIALSTQRFALAGLRGHFVTASAEELPYLSESFDCVSSTGVIHHTPRPERAVSEMRRVLRKDGLLALMVYHKNSFAYRVRMGIEHHVNGWSYEHLLNLVDGEGNPKGDVYTRREVRNLLTGFDIVDVRAGMVRLQDVYVFSRPPGSAALLWLMKRLERWFGWCLYVRAVRR